MTRRDSPARQATDPVYKAAKFVLLLSMESKGSVEKLACFTELSLLLEFFPPDYSTDFLLLVMFPNLKSLPGG